MMYLPELIGSLALVDHVNPSGLYVHFRIVRNCEHRRPDNNVIQLIAVNVAASKCISKVRAHLLAGYVLMVGEYGIQKYDLRILNMRQSFVN